MSYKLKDIIYNSDGYYPVFKNDDNDEKYKIKQNINIEKKDIESKIKIVLNNNLNNNINYTMDNIKDYLHR
jgi:hypothetical protein